MIDTGLVNGLGKVVAGLRVGGAAVAIGQHSQYGHLDFGRLVAADLHSWIGGGALSMDSFLSTVLSFNYLALTLFIPLVGFFIVTACPRTSRLPFFYAMVSSLGAFIAALRLIRPALAHPESFTSQIDEPWMSSLKIRLHMGVDGISLWLILLTTLLVPVAVWATERMLHQRRKSFFAMLMLFEFGLIGVFSALDLVAFYVFWEIALVPMYLMVGGWGGSNRV